MSNSVKPGTGQAKPPAAMASLGSTPTKPALPNNYKESLQGVQSGNIRREISKGDKSLAKALANALRAHPSPIPSSPPPLTNALQGNLAEFLVYDLGLSHWLLFDRKFSWASNAIAPWKESSDPGLDVLAFVFHPDNKILVIEVKSSVGTGTSSINEDESSLKNDFHKLFNGTSTSRLLFRLSEVFYELKFRREEPQLVQKLSKLVGISPATSAGVRLIGTLVCSKGVKTTLNVQSRTKAFNDLHQGLIAEGWKPEQIEFRCIELDSLKDFMTRVIQEAANDIQAGV
jgi:hypothetical protein